MKSFPLKIGLLIACLASGSIRALALDGVIVIANSSVAADSLTADELRNIYTAKTTYWADGRRIIIVVLPDETDAALQQASGMEASQFRTFWLRLAFSGRGAQPQKADDAAALVALVASTKGAIGLAPADAPLPGVKKIRIE